MIETNMSFIDPYQHIIVSHLLLIYSSGRGSDILLCMSIGDVAC